MWRRVGTCAVTLFTAVAVSGVSTAHAGPVEPSETPPASSAVRGWTILSNSDAGADAVIAANPTNEQLTRQVALTYLGDKNYDEALKFIDQSIKVKETFQNLSSKANILWAAGRKDEALTVADAAIAKGKADKANTTAFEKRVADMKAGKL